MSALVSEWIAIDGKGALRAPSAVGARIGVMTLAVDTYVAGTLTMHIPGRARSQATAMRDFEAGVAQLRKLYEPALWPLFVPEAKDIHRWRVQLECGCVHELFVHGEARFPDSRRYVDPITQSPLRSGEYWCTNEHRDVPKVYRDIVEWMERRELEFPADPEESIYEGMNPETWAQVRHTEPHSSAFWRVRLSCGHAHDSVVTDLDWTPEHGPKLTTPERAAGMRHELEALWTEDHTGWPEPGAEREHVVKMLAMRWPRPEPEQDCYACRHASRMIGYQRIGPLLGAETTGAVAPEVKRQRVEARLAAAEAEVARLRAQLESGDLNAGS